MVVNRVAFRNDCNACQQESSDYRRDRILCDNRSHLGSACVGMELEVFEQIQVGVYHPIHHGAGAKVLAPFLFPK